MQWVVELQNLCTVSYRIPATIPEALVNGMKNRDYKRAVPLYPAPIMTTFIGRVSSIQKLGSLYLFSGEYVVWPFKPEVPSTEDMSKSNAKDRYCRMAYLCNRPWGQFVTSRTWLGLSECRLGLPIHNSYWRLGESILFSFRMKMVE